MHLQFISLENIVFENLPIPSESSEGKDKPH